MGLAERARVWLRALRPLAHGNLAPPILLGQALSVAAGWPFDPLAFCLAHAFGLADHAFIVFANDLADHETDADNTTPTPVSGGSRVVPQGLLTPAALARAASWSAAALLGVSLVGALLMSRPLAPLFALAALGLLWAYSHGPRLSYRGGGELLQGLGLGVVLPLWGFYAQAGTLGRAPWAALGPLVLLHAVGNVLTALPDLPSDARAHKRTWPVRVGEATARRHVLVGLTLALLGVGLVVLRHAGALAACAVLAPPCVALVVACGLRRHRVLPFVLAGLGVIGLVQLAWAAQALSQR